MTATYIVRDERIRECAMSAIGSLDLSKAWEVRVKPHDRRTGEQNALLWAMLTDVSRQVDWYGQRLSKEEWKSVFTAALKRQKVVPGLDGGFVVLGTSTSKMTKAEFSDLVELMRAFGAEHGVRWIGEGYGAYQD